MDIREISAEETWELRQSVMWPDKNIDYVKLKEDRTGKHYGLFLGDMLVSVISIFEKNKEVQFRKFATLIELQGRGCGTLLLNYVLEQVVNWGVKKIWCNARKNKVNFYEGFGFDAIEDAETKDGIEYVKMIRNL